MSKRGGQVSTKQKKYAGVRDYLEAHHKKIYDLYAFLGMHSTLTPKRGGGMTFLLPDAKMVAEIEKLALSEDAEKATDILSGLVVQDYLADAKDWAEKQDDIPNLLGKRISVKNVSAGKVSLEGGAELTLDTKAKFLDRVGKRKRDPMSVWVVKGSFDPVSGSDATFKYVGKGGKKKEGGRVRGGLATTGESEVKKYVSNIAAKALDAERSGKDGKHVFVEECAKVCKVLMARNDDVAKKVFELPTWCCTSRFYLTFDNDHYIPTGDADLLRKEVVDCVLDSKPQDLMDEFCDQEWSDEDAAMATKEGRRKLKAVCAREADKLLTKSGLRMEGKVEDVFATYASENKLGSVSNMSMKPVAVVHKLKGGVLKQLMCYFDYYMRKYCKDHGLAAAIEFANVSNSIDDKLESYLGKFGNWAPGKQLSSTVGAGLVRSDAFFPVPRTSSEVMGAGEYDEEEAENPFSRELSNDDALGVEEVASCPTSEFQISKRAMNELAAYKAKFGKMPDL